MQNAIYLISVCVCLRNLHRFPRVLMPGDPLADTRVQQRLGWPLKSCMLRNLEAFAADIVPPNPRTLCLISVIFFSDIFDTFLSLKGKSEGFLLC